MRHFNTLLVVFLVCGCRPPAPQSSPPADVAVDLVLRKINERLALMEAVAEYKRQHGMPVQDVPREEALLRDLEAKAATHQLSPRWVRSFFRGQFEAAKLVQLNHLDRWHKQHMQTEEAIELDRVREQIDRLNDEMLAALALLRPVQRDRNGIERRAQELIVGDGIDDEVRSVATAPLLEQD